ncbi:leucine aminopeptidase 2, chloroplastic-like isoform X2 [Rosa rugosa]|uniref:leucine aminopeptidase 2, chloroplastic-like isoform X2 n=1 Tax=Rosa rugosa TaxID=74645 RepID=UPI002B4115AB|nr:leucine aminopeptidase 2, chloroplastic-like isoform X2 [Rosa rugosa]
METVGIQARVLIFFMELGMRALCLWWWVMRGQRRLGSGISGDVTTLVVALVWSSIHGLVFGDRSVQLTFATKEIDVTEWKGDLLAVGVTEKDLRKDQNSKFENPILKKLDSCLGGVLAEVSTKEDFTGKSGQSTVIRLPGLGSKRVGLFGLGQSAFDSGGYNIKTGPGCSIELMKVDMGGSAAVLGAAKAIGQIKPSGVEVHFIVAACENMISGTGMRPGDTVTASNGKTIEVREMFYHAFNGYMDHAFPLDELRPHSCGGEDSLGGYALTLIDALETLALLGDRDGFAASVEWIE